MSVTHIHLFGNAYIVGTILGRRRLVVGENLVQTVFYLIMVAREVVSCCRLCYIELDTLEIRTSFISKVLKKRICASSIAP